jgi:hypothetical protein
MMLLRPQGFSLAAGISAAGLSSAGNLRNKAGKLD